MTLVDCCECSGRVARSAKACPHCGAPDPGESEAATWLGIGCELIGGVLSIMLGVLSIVAALLIPVLVALAGGAIALFAITMAIVAA